MKVSYLNGNLTIFILGSHRKVSDTTDKDFTNLDHGDLNFD